jgi:shikimate dehydrogenase
MQINGSTKILGLFGNPVKHSLSPAMHNAGIQSLKINFVYLPLHVENDIETAVNAVRAFNFAGVNVTIPYKEKVIPFLDSLTDEAENIGAVNTIINDNGKLIGDNTDGKGFIRSLNENLKFDVAGKKCFIIGAGGASRSIAVSLIFAGADTIFVTDLSIEKAKNIARINDKIKVIASNEIQKIIEQSELVINATPAGMENDSTPFDLNYLSAKNTVYDIVYNRETPLIKYCKKNEIKCMAGLEMLLYQGVLAFEKWTKKKAPVEVMRQALLDAMKV